jgi:lysozyme family protein
MANFDLFSDRLIKIEGGYANNKNDRGGETKYGISKKYHPDIDIKNLTVEQAKEIYRKEYWDKWNFSDIRDQMIAELIFNFMVTNPAQTFRSIQKALNRVGVTLLIDGVMGKKTIDGLNHRELNDFWLLDRFKLEMIGYYNSIVSRDKTQLGNLNGWINRVIDA